MTAPFTLARRTGEARSCCSGRSPTARWARTSTGARRASRCARCARTSAWASPRAARASSGGPRGSASPPRPTASPRATSASAPARRPAGAARPRPATARGLFRKVNYVFDSERKRCRLIPKVECVDKNVGFSDHRSCKDACAQAASRRDARCGLGSLESVVRPCRWDDKVYTHYFDHTSKRCEPWDKTACISDAFPRLAECLRACVGPRSKYKPRHVAQH
ncbi:uncharacterized protein LOC144180654 [Haemaphysalis longicornis]